MVIILYTRPTIHLLDQYISKKWHPIVRNSKVNPHLASSHCQMNVKHCCQMAQLVAEEMGYGDPLLNWMNSKWNGFVVIARWMWGTVVRWLSWGNGIWGSTTILVNTLSSSSDFTVIAPRSRRNMKLCIHTTKLLSLNFHLRTQNWRPSNLLIKQLLQMNPSTRMDTKFLEKYS